MIDMEVKEAEQPRQETALVQIVRSSGLEKTKADFILEKFQDYFKIAADWEAKAKMLVVTSPDQVAEMKMAREGRLYLKAKRVEIERARKELKEQSLREGKAIDGIANVLKGLIEPTEDYLEQQEKFVELQEEKRKAEVRAARQEEMLSLGMVPELYDITNMPADIYAGLITARKDVMRQEEEAAKRAEEERIAREAEEKRMREENERLRKEAEERERVLAAERAEAEAKQRAAEEKIRKQKEEADRAALKAKQEAEEREKKLKAEQEARLRKEREERERIEAELKAKQQAEEKERKRLEAEAKKAARAPDKVKLLAFADQIEVLPAPQVKSEEARKILAAADGQLDRAMKFIREAVREL